MDVDGGTFEAVKQEELPRMGGPSYRLGPNGAEIEVRLVLHRCPKCQRRVPIEADHPMAFRGQPSCAHALGWGHHWGPCPAGPAAHALDDAIQQAHGPNALWTVWHGSVLDAENAVQYYSQGQILACRIIKTDLQRAEFAVLRYRHPDEILPAACGLRFGSLESLDLRDDEFAEKVRYARGFTSSRPRN